MSKTPSKIAGARTRKAAQVVEVLDAPTAAQWLAEVDPTLATLFDQLDERLKTAQDEERNAHPPVDLAGAQERLWEEQIALLVAGGNMVDQIMSLGELGVHAARELAGAQAAEMMATAGLRMPRAIPPRDLSTSEDSNPTVQLGGGNGGDGDPDPDLITEVLDDDGKTAKDIQWLRRLAADPVPTETGPDGYPIGTPPWDNPEGASTDSTVETVETVGAVPVERPRASSGRGIRLWARNLIVSAASAILGTAVALGVWTLFEQVRP